jgi:enoyl-CoA hydratase
MMEIIAADDIAILSLARPKVNAMDFELLIELCDHLDHIAASKYRAMVLSSSLHVFSAGVDLIRLLDEELGYLDRFLPALEKMFATLFRFPKPTIAAINGAAVAGGCVLACACDYRLIAREAKIGIPELRVGVPFPSIAMEIMRAVTLPQCFQQLVLTGKTFVGEMAVNSGLADEVADSALLMNKSLEMARQLTAVPHDVYACTKSQLRQPVLDRVQRSQDQFAAEIYRLWRRADIRREVRRYVEETFRPASRSRPT